jgi:hypothetical protein
MLDKYSFDIIKDAKDTNIKKLMYEIMNDTYNTYKNNPSVNMKDMNNITLNVARDYYTKKYGITKQTEKPVNIKTLERDANVYGPRVLNYEQIKPQISVKKEITNDFKQLEDNRRREQERKLPNIKEMTPVMESAYEPDEFMRKLSELEKRRDDVEIKDLTSLNESRLVQDSSMMNTIQHDPKILYQVNKESNEIADKQTKDILNIPISSRENLLPPQIHQMIILDKFISVNGFDRNWTTDQSRFNFKVDFNWTDNSIQNKYKNIKSIKATRVIIPMEIEEVQSIVNVPKTYFNYEFRFSFPYLLLNIDEFDNIYDGTNPYARKCFSHLVFDKCYRAPNGRGYLILNPIQNEKKIFHPSPLASLSKMTISLRKPNGELFNNSKDNYKIFKVEYELYNKQYLKIVTDKYFDKNEFYRGDTVILKNFSISNVDVSMNDQAISMFNDFINQEQGHEILEIGQANDSGYFKTFYISGPGEFDTETGSFVLNNLLIQNLNTYNNSIDFSSTTATNGSILNASLQCTIAFKLQSLATDPSLVDTSYYSKISQDIDDD